ncbi:MAG: HAD-IIA family hydrolase [Anaerolineae bacterium]|nr:MAG: HAD-IIA family hydrolase [Anaerolineae bacterium]
MNQSPAIKALILDMDGVLWKNYTPIVDLPAIFDRLREHGLGVVLATNNATRTPEWYLERLTQFGVRLQPWQVLNSAETTAEVLARRFSVGTPVYVVGEQGLQQALQRHDFVFDGERAQAVVVGLDKQVTYEKIKIASHLIRQGAAFIGTNPDRTFPTPRALLPGAGAILAAIEAASGVAPEIIGKPSPAMYRLALERLGTQPEETLAVGDRLETDILGGQQAGCRTALVLSGVTSRAEAEAWQPQPDWIASDLAALLDEVLRETGDGRRETEAGRQ